MKNQKKYDLDLFFHSLQKKDEKLIFKWFILSRLKYEMPFKTAVYKVGNILAGKSSIDLFSIRKRIITEFKSYLEDPAKSAMPEIKKTGENPFEKSADHLKVEWDVAMCFFGVKNPRGVLQIIEKLKKGELYL